MAPANQVTKDFTLARVNIVVGAHGIVSRLNPGTMLALYRDPKDKYDPDHAVMVVVPTASGNRKIGYLPPGVAKEIGPLLDAGVKVIARKAPNPLYGVCQLAYIPPVAAPVVEAVAPPPLPEGVTEDDIKNATDLPPLGDSRRPQKEEANDQPSPEPDGSPSESV